MDEKISDYYLVYGMQSGYPGSPGISEVELLMNEFEAHEGQEAKFVKRYKEIAEKSENPLIKLLLRLIVSDEEKLRVLSCRDVSKLDRWIVLAATARSTRELFESDEL